MPLTALVNQKLVVAPLLTDEEWTSLTAEAKAKKVDVILPCCYAPGHLRVSKLGTRHFFHHRRGECTTAPETVEHMKAKEEVALACRDAGWGVATEAAGDGWRADVLATRGNAKIAFEIQWSAQSFEETEHRQERYRQAGIRGCWLFRKLPRDLLSPCNEVPAFEVSMGENGALSVMGAPLHRLVGGLLGGKYRFCTFMTARGSYAHGIVFREIRCWRCQKPYHVYSVVTVNTIPDDFNEISEFDSVCGGRFAVYESPAMFGGGYEIEFSPEIVQAVEQFTSTPEGSTLHLATIATRHSKTVGESYRSFGCPWCDAMLGAFYLQNVRSEGRVVAQFKMPMPAESCISEEEPHWCYSEAGHFCGPYEEPLAECQADPEGE